ncbi:hypothetical protein NDU88_000915 [Pleurodeles waltl]|uniref:Endonuclease/exonuclease/phosphatase domain-containing protein n=1 Tax=Pleurodeles waltl TaxID=8319 RepID=A0AAV7TIN4_PLEWA|nr:hypothetical protein NDU88_000915 [Pleurodeles waltl]
MNPKEARKQKSNASLEHALLELKSCHPSAKRILPGDLNLNLVNNHKSSKEESASDVSRGISGQESKYAKIDIFDHHLLSAIEAVDLGALNGRITMDCPMAVTWKTESVELVLDYKFVSFYVFRRAITFKVKDLWENYPQPMTTAITNVNDHVTQRNKIGLQDPVTTWSWLRWSENTQEKYEHWKQTDPQSRWDQLNPLIAWEEMQQDIKSFLGANKWQQLIHQWLTKNNWFNRALKHQNCALKAAMVKQHSQASRPHLSAFTELRKEYKKAILEVKHAQSEQDWLYMPADQRTTNSFGP